MNRAVVDSRVDVAVLESTLELVWLAITTPELTQRFSFGLAFESSWWAGDAVRILWDGRVVAHGEVVLADPPRTLVYRLDDPDTGDVDCWITWQLDPDPDGVRVVFVADSLSDSAPDYGAELVENLRRYLAQGA